MVNRQVGKSRADREDRDPGVFASYKPRAPAMMKARATNRGGGFDSMIKPGFDDWRAKAGENTIRILPPTWDDHNNYGYSVFVHWNCGPEGKSSYLCLERNNKPGTKTPMGKVCPICNLQRQLAREGETEAAGKLRPNERIVCWIIDRDGDPRKPLVYMMPQMTDSEINDRCYDGKTGAAVNPDDPFVGRDITIKRKGMDLTTKYMITIDMEPSRLADDDRVLKKIEAFLDDNPIPSILNFYSEEHLERVVSGGAPVKDEDLDIEDEDVKPRKAKRVQVEEDEDEEPPRRARNGRGRDEEEDEPVRTKRKERDDEDEDEIETPRRAKRKTDDDEDEQEPENDEVPTRSKRRADDDDDEPRAKARAKSRDDDDEEEPVRERVRPRR